MIFRFGITCMIFSAVIALSACRSEPYNSATAELGNFLNSRLHRAIPEDRHYFVLIPSNKCPKCFSLDGKRYSWDFAQRITVISSVTADSFKHLGDVVFDQNDDIMRMAFINYAPKLVISEEAKVTAIFDFEVSGQQLDSLYQLERHVAVE